MLTIDQLNQIRDRVRAELQVRHPEGRLLISAGTVGLAAGARDVMGAALEEIKSLGLRLVVSGEDSNCSPEQLPAVRLLLPGQPEAVYQQVTPARVREIVRQLSRQQYAAADSN